MSQGSSFSGKVVPLDRENVDTDAIIPKQFLKSTARTGYGGNLFDAWRYLDVGEPGQDPSTRRPNPEFVLNQPRYAGATILVARDNFGCGSSREHAPWALLQHGMRAVIAPSFGDIFRNNALKNGLLVIALGAHEVDSLFKETEASTGYALQVNLEEQAVVTPTGRRFTFTLDPFRKRCLLEGLDEVSLALAHAPEIRAYEARKEALFPWLTAGVGA